MTLKTVFSIIQITSENNDLEFHQFKAAPDEAIQRHAPIKKWYDRANQAPLMNKKVNKEIMKRSRLRNKFLNTKSDAAEEHIISNVISV